MKLNYKDCFQYFADLCRMHIVFSVYASVDQNILKTILIYTVYAFLYIYIAKISIKCSIINGCICDSEI